MTLNLSYVTLFPSVIYLVSFTVAVRYANFRHTLRDLYSTPTKIAVSEKSPFSRGVIGPRVVW
jgi:hypothetical protein